MKLQQLGMTTADESKLMAMRDFISKLARNIARYVNGYHIRNCLELVSLALKRGYGLSLRSKVSKFQILSSSDNSVLVLRLFSSKRLVTALDLQDRRWLNGLCLI